MQLTSGWITAPPEQQVNLKPPAPPPEVSMSIDPLLEVPETDLAHDLGIDDVYPGWDVAVTLGGDLDVDNPGLDPMLF